MKPAVQRNTFQNLLYLLLSFPLGLWYFVSLLVSSTVGTALLVLGIGLPILRKTVLDVWNYAEVERRLTYSLTGIYIESPSQPIGKNHPGFARSLLERAIFWKSVAYLLLKLLLGSVVLVSTLAVWLPSLLLLATPIHGGSAFDMNLNYEGPSVFFVTLVGLFLTLMASRLTRLAAPMVAAFAVSALTDQQVQPDLQQRRLEALSLASNAANLASSVKGNVRFEALLEEVLSSTVNAAGAKSGAMLLETRQVLVGFTSNALQELLSQGVLEPQGNNWKRTAFDRGFVLTPKNSAKTKALAVVPFTDRKAQLLLAFDHEPPRRAEIDFLATIADQISIALENSRLIAIAQNQAALEERHKLARELHDSVSQALYGISLGAKTAKVQLERDPSKAHEALDYVLQLAEAGSTEMRALIFELRPESLEQEGLVAALRKQAEMMRLRYKIEVDTYFAAEPNLPLEVKQALLRIAQEALHNTVKHARAKRAKLELQTHNLLIADDGVGFDPNQRFDGKLGQRTMRERAESFGARFMLVSSPQTGTTIQVEW